MFHYWIISIVLFQLPSLSHSLQCQNCSQTFNLINSSDVLNPTDCGNDTVSAIMCRAVLLINYQTGEVNLNLDGVSNGSLPDDTKQNFITSDISIFTNFGNATRRLELYCLTNDSCLGDMNVTYNEIRKQNISGLITHLRGKLGDGSSSPKLLCRNNQNNQVPCPNGQCELINSGSNFQRRCNLGVSTPSVHITSVAVGNDATQAEFTYHCAKNLCNDGDTASAVRSSLDSAGLLEPRGVVIPKPPGNSVSPMIADTKLMILLSWIACALALFGH